MYERRAAADASRTAALRHLCDGSNLNLSVVIRWILRLRIVIMITKEPGAGAIVPLKIEAASLSTALMKRGLLLLVVFLSAVSLRAAVQFQKVEYKQGDTVCEGLLVFDDSIQGKRPGILVAHQWKGLTDYEKMRAEMLAQRGYVAFCADVYGKGVRADNPQRRVGAGREIQKRPAASARAHHGGAGNFARE